MKKYPIKFNEFPEQCQHCSNLRCYSLYMSGDHDYMCPYYIIYIHKNLDCPHKEEK